MLKKKSVKKRNSCASANGATIMEKLDPGLVQSKPDIKYTTHFIATGFASGLMPKAPGTWGSLAALPLAYLIIHMNYFSQVFVVTLACLFGIWVCQKVSNDLKVEDHPAIVWDEFCGIFIALMFTPVESFWWIAPIGFVAFRYFDIAKPSLIGYLDRTQKGGWGIMADDILAGIAALAVVQSFLFISSIV